MPSTRPASFRSLFPISACPELDGMGFLAEVRQRWPDTAVVMLSGMAETSTAVDALQLGAADFLLKPVAVKEMHARVVRVMEKRSLVIQNRYYQAHLERRVHAQAERIKELFLEGVQMLARALEAKDAYIRGHSIRVSQLRRRDRQHRAGVRSAASKQIRIGGELHDIGKIGMREAVLQKPGSLTDDEFRQVIEHPGSGRAHARAARPRDRRPCFVSCARITSASTAGAFPTDSAGATFRSRRASSPSPTPSTQ